MGRREQLDVRPDLAVLADRDRGDVERRQVDVDEGPRADRDPLMRSCTTYEAVVVVTREG
jgi:hypothetical protein